MSKIWTFDDSVATGQAVNAPDLADYLCLADTYRHSHFAEGLVELEARAAGQTANGDLDQHTVFAAQVKRRADLLREDDLEQEEAYLALRRCTLLTWLCCFAGVSVCDQVADQLEQEEGWKARAEFIVLLSEVRDALGPAYFADVPGLETDVESAAQSRLRARWASEAIVACFAAPEYGNAQSQVAWIAQLDRASLHDFVLHFEDATEGGETLIAVADHPQCDAATAAALWARCAALSSQGTGISEPLQDVMNRICERFSTEGYGLSQFHPGAEMLAVIQDQTEACHSPRHNLPVQAIRSFGAQRHAPKYTFCGQDRVFRTHFSDWSAIRLVSVA